MQRGIVWVVDFSYANQLGARQGAGAVYLHAHHPDILESDL